MPVGNLSEIVASCLWAVSSQQIRDYTASLDTDRGRLYRRFNEEEQARRAAMTSEARQAEDTKRAQLKAIDDERWRKAWVKSGADKIDWS